MSLDLPPLAVFKQGQTRSYDQRGKRNGVLRWCRLLGQAGKQTTCFSEGSPRGGVAAASYKI